jgi:hypothetical protein
MVVMATAREDLAGTAWTRDPFRIQQLVRATGEG